VTWNSILEGMPKLPATLTALSVAGKTYSMADLKTELGGFKATFDTAAKAHSDAAAADEAVQNMAPTAVPFVAAVRDALKAALGKKSTALETVGVTPNKTPAPLPPEKEMAKVAKAKATRAARHTMGKNQKAAIKGQVPPPPAKPGP
jgi:hypothetical protein